MHAATELAQIKERLNAATPGPWKVHECTPCTERGRLEVNIYDAAGNLMVTNWCDDDEFHRPDAEFIAAAPADVARLTKAVEAVLALHTSDGHKNLIGPYCEHCISPIDGGPELWPCATVKAINAALDPS